MDERERFETGMKTRREVLGDAHVDAAIAKRNTFSEAFQDLITRYAWGEIWTRPGLPQQTRSLITVAMLDRAKPRRGTTHAFTRRAKKWCNSGRNSRDIIAISHLLWRPSRQFGFSHCSWRFLTKNPDSPTKNTANKTPQGSSNLHSQSSLKNQLRHHRPFLDRRHQSPTQTRTPFDCLRKQK